MSEMREKLIETLDKALVNCKFSDVEKFNVSWRIDARQEELGGPLIQEIVLIIKKKDANE